MAGNLEVKGEEGWERFQKVEVEGHQDLRRQIESLGNAILFCRGLYASMERKVTSFYWQ